MEAGQNDMHVRQTAHVVLAELPLGANTTTYGSMIAFSAYEFTGPTHARGTDYFELTALMQCTVILAGNTRASRDATEAQKLARTRLRTYPETQNTLENIILNTRSDPRGSSFRPT